MFPLSICCSWLIFFPYKSNSIIYASCFVTSPLTRPSYFPTSLFSCLHASFHIHVLKHACLPSLSLSVPSWLSCYTGKALGKTARSILFNSDSEETRKNVKIYWHVHEDILFSLVVLLAVLARFTIQWQKIEVLKYLSPVWSMQTIMLNLRNKTIFSCVKSRWLCIICNSFIERRIFCYDQSYVESLSLCDTWVCSGEMWKHGVSLHPHLSTSYRGHSRQFMSGQESEVFI